jgi:hypothetical protein
VTFEFELLQAALNVSFIVSLLLHRRWVSHLERTVDNLAKAVECHQHAVDRGATPGLLGGCARFKDQQARWTDFIDRVIK